LTLLPPIARMSLRFIFISLILIILLDPGSIKGETAGNDPVSRYWIFFKDKGHHVETGRGLNRDNIPAQTPRAVERRRRLNIGWDIHDLPVFDEYMEGIERTGAKIHRVSRWLNAVSVWASREQLSIIDTLDYVQRIKPVGIFHREIPPITDLDTYRLQIADSLYGESFHQLNQAGIVALHRLDYDGRGVLITILDSGFYIDHHAFDSMRSDSRIMATYDFINNDPDVQDGDDVQRGHGTTVLSVVSGFSAGNLIGGAFGADIALAKTELVYDEIRVEEDNWVAAVEWGDSIGTDIICSSLGYNQWYVYDDMDGNTAVTTIAADIAASRGILVVNAAGNEGDDPWRYIISPADGDSVLAVGSVDSAGVVSRFSSVGPTADGRIKPDIMAMGSRVRCALAQGADIYGYSGGTSLSTPIAVSAAALILQAHPALNPVSLIDTIRAYGSRSGNPDNIYGWGIINALKSSGAFRVNLSTDMIFTGGQEFNLIVDIAGSGGPVENDVLKLSVAADSSLEIQSQFLEESPGRYVAVLSPTDKPGGQTVIITDSTRDFSEDYFINVISPGADYSSYFSNYPNPFRGSTTFTYYLPYPMDSRLIIYTVSGEKVRDIHIPSSESESGINYRDWNADNRHGKKVAGGVYICILTNRLYTVDTKVVHLGD
jgi:serine protease AprX